MKKSLLSIIALAGAVFTMNASAATYQFSHTPAASSIMSSYSTTWNDNTETLTLDSTWNAGANINRIAFLICDGGSPCILPNEQFLWHDLDLLTGVMTVSNYFGPRSPLQTFTGPAQGVTTTASSVSLSIDSSYLNSLTAADFPGFSDYQGNGFSTELGIWHFMYGPDEFGDNILKGSLDLHHAITSQVPIPAAAFLFAPVLAGFVATRRRLAAK